MASLILQLLGVLGMLVAKPHALLAAVPAGGTSSRSWAMGYACRLRYTAGMELKSAGMEEKLGSEPGLEALCRFLCRFCAKFSSSDFWSVDMFWVRAP